MNKTAHPVKTLIALVVLLSLPALMVRGQSLLYSNAIINLNPAGYWPMHEIASAAPADIETNYGSLGTLGTAYYADWAISNGVPGNHCVLHQIPGPLVNDPNTAAYMVDPGITAASAPITNSYLLVPHTSPLTTLRPPFTEEVWMMATNTGFGDLISQDGTATNAGNANNTYGVRLTWGAGSGYSSASEFFQVYNGITTSNGFSTNMWHYVVLVCDASSNYFVYVDNTFVATKVNSGFKPDSWDPLTIGAGLWQGSGLIRETALSLDEVAIYTNALSLNSISNHFYAATNASAVAGDYYHAVINDNPLLYYRMDSPAYTALPPVNTWPVLNNYGSITGNGVYRPGVAPGSVAGPYTGGTFYTGLIATNAMPGNGLSSFADAGNDPAFNPTNHMPLSITACFKGNPADSRYQNIVGHSDNSWRLAINTDGRLHFNVVPGAGNDAISSRIYNDGNWHQVVATFDGTSNLLYVDGVLDGQTAVGTNVIVGTTNDVLLGADPQYLTINVGAGRQFAGNLCEVAFYTNALTFAQVRSLYDNLGVPVSITQQPVSASLNQGAAFTNTVLVVGSGPIYQWYKDNLPISGATNSTLIFNPVLPGDADTNYYVVVTNFLNSVTSKVVSLTVYSNVLVTSFPQSQTNTISLFAGMVVNGTNYLGSSPSFSVSTLGESPITYQWFTNNVAVGGATGTSLGFTNCQITSPTNIYCVAVNSYGPATGTVWSVSYLPAPMAPFPQAVLAAQPTAYWRLNDPPGPNNGNPGDAGEIATDYQGANNGVYTNVYLNNSPGYSQSTDPGETCGNFGWDAGNGCFAGMIGTNVDVSAPSGSSAEFTIALWANGQGNTQAGNAGLATKGYFNGEEFNLDNGGPGNSLRLEVRDAGAGDHSATNQFNSFKLGNDSNWHFIVGVCDQANSSLLLYLDGRLVGKGTINAGIGVNNAGPIPIEIGARNSSAGTPGNNQFVGLLNDVALYHYALSPGQVASQYDAVGDTVIPYFYPVPSTNGSAGINKTLTIPVTAIGTPPIGFVWTNVTAGGSVVASGVTNATTLNATLNYANIPASWNSNQLELIVTNAYGSTNSFFTLSLTNTVNLHPTNIVFSVTGGNLTLSWPSDHTGWQLQAQTNSLAVGLSTNWSNVPNSTNVNQVTIPINLTNGGVFYRLIYP